MLHFYYYYLVTSCFCWATNLSKKSFDSYKNIANFSNSYDEAGKDAVDKAHREMLLDQPDFPINIIFIL